MLIFDEVITGQRVAPGRAQELLGVTPDISLGSKALGGGYPICAFGARREIMQIVSDRKAVHAPLVATDTMGRFDIWANVHGGGPSGQAGAVLLGISRALLEVDPAFESVLRAGGYLTRDPRMVERKKYGQSGARRRFQFSKR